MSRTVSRFGVLFTLVAPVLFGACSDSSEPDPGAGPGPGPDQEMITGVAFILTPAGGGSSMTATVDDLDGPGPNPPAAPSQVLALTIGTTYDGRVEFYDISNPMAEDLTPEIAAEANRHRVFFTVSGLNGVTIDDLNLDANNAPLGLTFTLTASGGASGIGSIRVALNHYDVGAKGDGSTPSGTIDANVIFNASF